jgi:hypothetical protein
MFIGSQVATKAQGQAQYRAMDPKNLEPLRQNYGNAGARMQSPR